MIKNNNISLSFFFILSFFVIFNSDLYSQSKDKWTIVIHGGAGNFKRIYISTIDDKLYRSKLNEALKKGSNMLKNGKNAIEVVEAVIVILENSPLFNAGKGAVFNSDGKNILDASIMDGQTLNAGSVSGVYDIKNPIIAARKVMNNSEHVMLSGKGASNFAKSMGLKIVDNSYFFTENSWEKLQYAKEKESDLNLLKEKWYFKHGTVGCVVLDKYGNLAAGSSTGGMTNKKYGRIGATPIIGAGNYANNNTCAVTCTGHGEYFLRYLVAYDLSALLEYKKIKLDEATNYIINKKLKKIGGSGGLIAIDKSGNISIVYNTTGMFRGYSKSNGKTKVMIYNDE